MQRVLCWHGYRSLKPDDVGSIPTSASSMASSLPGEGTRLLTESKLGSCPRVPACSRAYSSVGERLLDMQEVGGSKPPRPIESSSDA